MAKFEAKPTVIVEATMRLTEQELGALDALAGYGFEPFLAVFKDKLGSSYVRDYEDGLKSLFESVRHQVPHILQRARYAREAFEKGMHRD
jgi:hypothetical protein